MHKVATWILALWLLTVNVAGWCCRLPSEAPRTERRGATAVRSHARACCCQQCARQGSPVSIAPASCCRGQCHEICRYLPTTKVQVEEGATAAPLDQCVLTPAPLELLASAHSTFEGGAGFLSDPPRLRLHLLHQILLV